MNVEQTNPIRHGRWAHACAWLLVCATFPLIWVGGLVTTTDAGMAFRDWLTSDGHLMPFYPWLSSAGDKFVEHGHRLLGMTAGILSIVLVVSTWLSDRRRWVRMYSLFILGAVILQGVLGGMRILLDERTLALIHGCTGPLFFALCVGMVVLTSRWWKDVRPIQKSAAVLKVFRLAIVCTCLAYGQLVVGAVVRHSPHMLSETSSAIFQMAVYFHLFLALLILVHVMLLAWRCLRSRLQVIGGIALLGLVVAQLALGMTTWLVKYGMPRWASALFGDLPFVNKQADFLQTSIVTGHVAVGSLILIAAFAIALRLGRQLGVAAPRLSASTSHLVEVML